MIRLTLVLCAGIFVMLLVMGEDRGQRRAGLMAADTVPRSDSPLSATPAGAVAARDTAAEPLNLPVLPLIQASAVVDPIAEAVADAETSVVDETAVAADTPAGKLRWIEANSVNVREGPSTEFPVLDKLTRGEAVLVVLEEGGGEGWSRVRIEGDGIEGFVATRFLTDAAP